jgi:hypothetical protein
VFRLAGLAVVCLSALGTARAGEPVDYTRQIKPLLKARCYPCHGALKRKAGLRLDTGALIRDGGDGGPAVEPGHADESLLVDRVADSDPAFRMPPEGSPLTPEQVSVLRDWIDQGANTPPDERPEADPREHWSFRGPVRPDWPAGVASLGSSNPVDAFLVAEHVSRGLAPLPPAEPHVVLRRLYLDLIGLPPTREELHAFLADPSEANYERTVDRLLASPQYGERWARHWMDVWRYSDWYGRRAVPDVTNSYAMIWRWRDWIVRSLNDDRPYDEMVRLMLAADELEPADESDLAATGYVVRNFYRWNYNTWMKDTVEHTSRAFLGLTIQCAHCHDHKYDPITQEDYFAFRAVFEPLEIRHDRVPGEPDPGPYPKYDYGKAYAPITSGLVRVMDEKLDAQTFLYTRGESRNIVPDRPPIPPGAPRFLAREPFSAQVIDLPPEASYPGLKEFVRREEMSARDAAVAVAEQATSKAEESAAGFERARSETEAHWRDSAPRAFPRPWPSVTAFVWLEEAPPAEVLKARADHEAAVLGLRAEQAALGAAHARREALRACIEADDAKYGRTSGDAKALALAASKAERVAAREQARLDLARAETGLSVAREKARLDPSAQAEVAKAEQALAGARKTLDATEAALAQESDRYTPLGPVYPTRSTGRRAALARWITHRSNPLTARVAVNHLWRWHFGRALVETTDNFGRNGKPPSNPALLDWLAVELMDPSTPGAQPWSMKRLHRLIVTSRAYRTRSHAPPDHPNRALDPENQAYWRFPPSRMEAEVIRDSLLHVAGALDTAIGGPDIDYAQGLTSHRRSLYFTHHGEAKMGFLELFDAPDACEGYRRTTSVMPQQALALSNSELAVAMARTLASRLWDEAGNACEDAVDREAAFIASAFEQVLTRPPSPQERELSSSFLARQASLLRESAGPSTTAPEARAREDLVHALFNHNDFVTIR